MDNGTPSVLARVGPWFQRQRLRRTGL